jgi:Glycosyltransferase like family 2
MWAFRGAVRNVGLAKARGEYVAFLDSDDAWLPEKLDRQVETLDRDPRIGIVCTNAAAVDEAGRSLGYPYLRPEQGRSGAVLADLIRDNFVIASTAVVRRAQVEKVGGFTEEPLLRGVEDYDLWLRIATEAHVIYLREPLAVYREHPSSMRQEVPRSVYCRSMLRALERLQVALDGRGVDRPGIRAMLERVAAEHRLRLAEAEEAEAGHAMSLRARLWVLARDQKQLANALSRRASALRRAVLRGAPATTAARSALALDRPIALSLRSRGSRVASRAPERLDPKCRAAAARWMSCPPSFRAADSQRPSRVSTARRAGGSCELPPLCCAFRATAHD